MCRVEKPVSATQHMGHKTVLRCFPLLIELILLHAVVVLHYIHHIKWHAWSNGKGCQNAPKQIIIKAHESLILYKPVA